MALKLVRFSTDSDGPARQVSINPEYVATVEQDMAKPGQICHLTMVNGQYYRILEPEEIANKRLQYGS
ncbi:hypothetical protein GGR92_003644 [Spirosoma lacussanchae]|uniref:hypothetical protein n=1 Tax=Spirosoma lacussanchae TaxID=1884249 RepID=UPI0011095C93|nr:hypothetical protein [Spirosoma lacussanchae]